MVKKEEMKLVYLCIQKRIKDRSKNGVIPKKEVFIVFSNIYHLQKKFWYPVLKEMVDLELLECPDKNTVRVLKNDTDLKDTSKIYRRLGLY